LEAETDEQQVPSGLARLWTLRQGQQSSREPRVGLSLDRIVASAIQLADTGGLEAVSMSRVAQSLGFATMSIYRHVANKDEMLLLMHDAAWEVPASLDHPVGSWRENLTRWCRAQFDVTLRHPWLERIRLGERVGTPSQLTWIDRGLRALADTPLSERDKADVLLLLNGYVFWEARLAAETAAPGEVAPEQVAAAVSQMMAAVVDPARLPALRRAFDSGAFDFSEANRFTDAHRGSAFDFGLNLILDGIEQLISRGSTR
jgi:AcrR family transcriptional regulator